MVSVKRVEIVLSPTKCAECDNPVQGRPAVRFRVRSQNFSFCEKCWPEIVKKVKGGGKE